MSKSFLSVIAVAVLLVAGCAAHALHPGAANKFDSDSYDAVLVTHNLIETTKTDLGNNAFPAAIAGNVKTALNDLIKAYDIADTAYVTYHSAALAGTATSAQQTALTNALTSVNTSTTALTAAKASKPTTELICPEGSVRIDVLNSDLTSHPACAFGPAYERVLIGAN